MDRGLVGVLLICFVASTTFAALFLGLEPSERITLIRLDAFKGPLEKTRPYTIELLAREPAQSVAVELSYLVRVNEETHERLVELLDVDELLKSSGVGLTKIPKVEEELRMMDAFPSRPAYRYFRDKASYEDLFREAEYELAVLDIRDFLKYLPASAGPEAYGAFTVFAVLRHEENVSFYQGACDYYLNRLDSMGEVLIERDGGSALYENPRVIVPRTATYVDIRQAPSFGTVTFEDLQAEETIRVFFTTRHLAGPGLLIARVWVDGDVVANYYSFAGWPETEY